MTTTVAGLGERVDDLPPARLPLVPDWEHHPATLLFNSDDKTRDGALAAADTSGPGMWLTLSWRYSRGTLQLKRSTSARAREAIASFDRWAGGEGASHALCQERRY